MQVKRYIAADAHEAMSKVKGELGKDAVILNTRKIRQKGIRGLFAKPLIEVVAAVEDNPVIYSRSKEKEEKTAVDDGRLRRLEEQILQINKRMRNYMNSKFIPSSVSLYPPSVQQFYDQLLEEDVEEDYAWDICDRVNEILMSRNGSSVKEAALAVMEACFGKSFPIPTAQDKRRIVLFVGATGIGKTTTLAKLAAIYTLKYKKKVGLITTDTYRIAAAEQLRIYADLLKIPLRVIYSPEEIHGPLSEYENRDLILIDTSGKNSKDIGHQRDIKQLIRESKADDVFLVISATTSYKSCKAIWDAYRELENYQLILTKLDESESLGNLLNTRLLFDKPIAYITNGQGVPDDIAVGDSKQLAEMIWTKIQTQGERA